MTRVAFTVFGGDGWTGGLNYLRNLLAALADLPGRPVQPLLFVGPGTPPETLQTLAPLLARPPVEVPGWGPAPAMRARRLLGSAVLQRDAVSLQAFEREGVRVVFQHAAWYGVRFPLPTLAWIADFQHRHLPQMFSAANRLKRDLGYAALSRCATRLMVSSQDARQDCERCYPEARGRVMVLPFAVTPPDPAHELPAAEVRALHGLPERYLYLPNQLWRHKNHGVVLRALRRLRERGSPVRVVATGKAADVRNPAHPAQTLEFARSQGLEESFRFLGLVPYAHVMPLARGALALLNPSLFEGWSTTVEEAKAMAVPMLLSDIPLHREQAGDAARYFDPHDDEALAALLQRAWDDLPPSATRAAAEAAAATRYAAARLRFAQRFADTVAELADPPAADPLKPQAAL